MTTISTTYLVQDFGKSGVWLTSSCGTFTDQSLAFIAYAEATKRHSCVRLVEVVERVVAEVGATVKDSLTVEKVDQP